MNVVYRLHDVHFEWDDEKAAANFDKHDVTFTLATEVFFDPFIKIVDEEMVDAELRESAIGMTVSWRLFYVVYTLREEIIRLISARPAARTERRLYENQ